MSTEQDIDILDNYCLCNGGFPYLTEMNKCYKKKYEKGHVQSGLEILNYPRQVITNFDAAVSRRLAVAQSPFVLNNRKIAIHFKCQGEFATSPPYLVSYFILLGADIPHYYCN